MTCDRFSLGIPVSSTNKTDRHDITEIYCVFSFVSKKEVTIFNYLGVTFTKNGKFKLAKQKNIEKATKAMYEVIRREKRHNLSIEYLLDLL